jgi:hypothetical protein
LGLFWLVYPISFELEGDKQQRKERNLKLSSKKKKRKKEEANLTKQN